MHTISAAIVIQAPADAVWEVIGHQFDRVGEWATAVPFSRAAPDPAAGPAAAEQAPVAGRVCRTGLAILPEVTERIIAYDEAGRTLTYQAERLPRLLPTASNQWRVETIDDNRSRVNVHATVQTHGIAGQLAYLLLRVPIARASGRFLRDLKHYIEHGHPTPRKQRQLRTSPHTSG